MTLPACAMEAVAKKMKLPNPCRGIASAIEAGAAKAKGTDAASAPGASLGVPGVSGVVASVASGAPEKVPS